MLLAELALTADAVRSTSGRTAKVSALAELLQRTAAGETAAVVAWLSGVLLQRQIGVGWAALRELPEPAPDASLTIADVRTAFDRIGASAGAGSQSERRGLLSGLLARATADEQALLRGLLSGGLRQGALEGVMADAVARAAGVGASEVRRALFLRGDLAAVAEVALHEGPGGLAAIRLQVGRPVLPMLAGSASDVEGALARTGPAAVEWKLDGLRIQVHRDGKDVGVFTRSLDDWTARMPGVVTAALELPLQTAVLDGEALALRDDGRPHRFQDSSRMPLQPFLFDILHLDGADLLDEPASERARVLAAVAPQTMRVPRAEVGEDVAAGEAVLRDALELGHEGVMVKALADPYAAGRRGTGWVKVKQAHTLDLVVLAVEWGSGRRQGLLSNLHLGARDPETGGFVMLGKTFKGMTDLMLAWQTEALLALETHREGHVVYVRPELVVEIAFDGVQTSTRYPGGMALRFARVKGYRPDKRASEADVVDALRAIHQRT